MRPGNVRTSTPRSRLQAWGRVLAVLFAGAFANCACDDDAVVALDGPGDLVVEPLTIDLGRVFIGTTVDTELRVRSVGEGAVAWTSRFGGFAPGFVLVGATGGLEPGTFRDLPLSFRPGEPGLVEAELLITSDQNPPRTSTVTLRAEGVPIPDCEDGNGCTVDTFDLELGSCRHEAQRLPCDDFDACTMGDTCADGICRGEGTICDDGDVCTDDFCDVQAGCVNQLRVDCDDGNPCTIDRCDPVSGCRNDPAPDFTICADGIANTCIETSVCLGGRCDFDFKPPTEDCDDGDPCSPNDRCIEGVCRDPDYTPPAPGELKFRTEVGSLAPGARRNPLISPEGDIYVGTETDVVAVNECGVEQWRWPTESPPNFGAALLTPLGLSVPVGTEVVDLDADGAETRRLDVASALPPTDRDVEAVEILDMAARASSALVVSVARTLTAPTETEGFLVEVDRNHEVATVFAAFGPFQIARVAIDLDESLVLILRSENGDERLIRLGIEGVAGGTWSLGPVATVQSDVGLGAAGEVYWSAGLARVQVGGVLQTLRAPPPNLSERSAGPPILFGPVVWTIEPNDTGEADVVARTGAGAPLQSIPLPGAALASGPVVDGQGRIFILSEDGVLHSFDADGQPVFTIELEDFGPVGDAAIALSSDGLLVVALGAYVYGIQSFTGLAFSPWPKHRRDNFGTSHR